MMLSIYVYKLVFSCLMIFFHNKKGCLLCTKCTITATFKQVGDIVVNLLAHLSRKFEPVKGKS